jgi:predicted nucleic acid-binding protein
LLGVSQLVLADPQVVAAAVARYRKARGVQFADCLILETARKAGHLPLVTFDADLGKLDGTLRL